MNADLLASIRDIGPEEPIVEDTGGGCTALVVPLAAGWMVATDPDGMRVPEGNPEDLWLLGIYPPCEDGWGQGEEEGLLLSGLTTAELVQAMHHRAGLETPWAPVASVAAVAAEFSRVLREWLTAEEMAAVIAANRQETHPGICHSHDVCDANEAMAEALTRLGLDYDLDLWCDAWARAQSAEFSPEVEQ